MCKNLRSVKLNSENIKIGEGAFEGCKGLADENGFVIVNDTLYDYVGRKKTVTIPDNVNKISWLALAENNSINSVIFKNPQTEIVEGAFILSKNFI